MSVFSQIEMSHRCAPGLWDARCGDGSINGDDYGDRGATKVQNLSMNLDDAATAGSRLPPLQAQMVEAILATVHPLPGVWRRVMANSLAAALSTGLALTAEQVADVQHAAFHPRRRADWLIGNNDFMAAHAFACEVALAISHFLQVALDLDAEPPQTLH